MAATIIKERYYILTPLSCLLGVLVLIATLLLAAASYLRSIDKTMAGYGHMLTSIDATPIHELVQDNQRQLGVLESSLDKGPSLGRGGHQPDLGHRPPVQTRRPLPLFLQRRTHRRRQLPHWQTAPGYQAALCDPGIRRLGRGRPHLVWSLDEFDSASRS